MHISQHNSTETGGGGVKFPPIGRVANSDQNVSQPANSGISGQQPNSRTIQGQCLIYRSVPPTPKNFTLTDMIGAEIIPPKPVKANKVGLSGSSSSEFAKRFMSRPTRQPKVVDFNIGRLGAEKRRRGNGFFPSVKLRVSAKGQSPTIQKENKEFLEADCQTGRREMTSSGLELSLTCREWSEIIRGSGRSLTMYEGINNMTDGLEWLSGERTEPLEDLSMSTHNENKQRPSPTKIKLQANKDGSWQRVNEVYTNESSPEHTLKSYASDVTSEGSKSCERNLGKSTKSATLPSCTMSTVTNRKDAQKPKEALLDTAAAVSSNASFSFGTSFGADLAMGETYPAMVPSGAFSRGVLTREGYTTQKLRNNRGGPIQPSGSNLQLIPTTFSEVQPKSASRSISRASKQSIPRKTPESVRTAPAAPENVIVYPETFECDDLSYLPPPKRILPKRDVPWVFRYKVKRNMNELSKIMASKPQIVDV